ncbi:hypothetical protein P692DRAFT_20908890 [Suillus brevipes Sb2]|nr:hypothetical protein P692DRAFT_20908890 [Suillus brevipes Sb2]
MANHSAYINPCTEKSEQPLALLHPSFCPPTTMARHRNQQPQPPQVPVPLGTVPIPGLPDMQALQSLLAALGPNAMTILSSMQGGIPMNHVPQHAPQPLVPALPPPAPVINLQPRAEPPLNALNHILQRLETIEKSLKRPQHDEDNDADDEEDSSGAVRRPYG